MRRLGSGGAGAALLLGLGAAIAAAGGPSAPKGLFSGMFDEKPPASTAKGNQAVKNGNQPAAPRPAPMRSTEMDAADQERHLNANMRRMEVCDRLRNIALQTGNDALMNLANELEDRANDIYRRQTSRLPLAIQTPPSGRQTEPMAANGARNAERKEAPALPR